MKKLLIEIKARYPSLNIGREVLKEIGARYIGSFHQIDIYFLTGDKRLKLREIENEKNCKLVYYIRENIKGPKKSSIIIVNTADCEEVKSILEDLIGVKVVVDKIREIYNYKGVEIHLDTVRDLGTFIEFEKPTSNKISEDRVFLKELMKRLKIRQKDLVKGSYSDLLIQSS